MSAMHQRNMRRGRMMSPMADERQASGYRRLCQLQEAAGMYVGVGQQDRASSRREGEGFKEAADT